MYMDNKLENNIPITVVYKQPSPNSVDAVLERELNEIVVSLRNYISTRVTLNEGSPEMQALNTFLSKCNELPQHSMLIDDELYFYLFTLYLFQSASDIYRFLIKFSRAYRRLFSLYTLIPNVINLHVFAITQPKSSIDICSTYITEIQTLMYIYKTISNSATKNELKTLLSMFLDDDSDRACQSCKKVVSVLFELSRVYKLNLLASDLFALLYPHWLRRSMDGIDYMQPELAQLYMKYYMLVCLSDYYDEKTCPYRDEIEEMFMNYVGNTFQEPETSLVELGVIYYMKVHPTQVIPLARSKALDMFTSTKNINVKLSLLRTVSKQVYDLHKPNIPFNKFSNIIQHLLGILDKQRVILKQIDEDLNNPLMRDVIYDREVQQLVGVKSVEEFIKKLDVDENVMAFRRVNATSVDMDGEFDKLRRLMVLQVDVHSSPLKEVVLKENGTGKKKVYELVGIMFESLSLFVHDRSFFRRVCTDKWFVIKAKAVIEQQQYHAIQTQLDKRGGKLKTYKMYLVYRVKGEECFPFVVTVNEVVKYLNEVDEVIPPKIEKFLVGDVIGVMGNDLDETQKRLNVLRNGLVDYEEFGEFVRKYGIKEDDQVNIDQ